MSFAQKSLRLSFGQWMVVISAVMFAISVMTSPTASTVHLGFLCFLSVLFPVLIISLMYREVNYSALKFILAIMMLVGPGRHLYFTVFVDRFNGDWFYVGQTQDGFIFAATLMVLFNASLALGYALSGLLRKRVLPRRLEIANPAPAGQLEFFVKLAVCLLAMFGAFMSLEATGGFRFLTSQKSALIVDGERFAMGQWLMLTKPIAFVYVLSFLRILTNTRGRFEWGIFLFAVLFTAWWGYVKSVRGEIIVMLVTLLFTYYLVRNRFSMTTGLLGGGLGIGFATVMTQIRQMGAVESEFSFSMAKVVEPFIGEYNLGGFVALKQLMAMVPDVLPYSYGATFLQFLWIPIPRSIWRDKPLAVGEYLLSGIPALSSVRKGGGAASAMIGEAFLNFGYVGLLIVPFLFGILLWHLDRLTLAFSNRIVALAVMICAVVSFTYNSFGYYFASGTLDIILSAMPALALLPITFAGRGRGLPDLHGGAASSLA